MSAPHPLTAAVLSFAAGLVACDGSREAEGEPAGAWPVAIAPATAAQVRYERVVLVTIDTLRADHVSCYGYPRATTPFLDSMAARGARFTRATSAMSHTAPAHATMLTGLVPAVHGLVENGGTLDPRATDLAQVFARSGFETAAFLNVKFLTGIAASFGHVAVRALSNDPGSRRILNGGDVVDAAIDWLRRERRTGRFLLWVHLYDPHKWKDVVIERTGDDAPIWSGATPADSLDRTAFFDVIAAQHGLPPRVPGQEYVLDWSVEKKGGEHLEGVHSAEGFLRCIDAYDELVRFSDAQLARLYREIERLELPGRTLWVVTSDHGEGLASHGVAGHGGRIYQEQLHVPLVLHASDGSLAAREIDELVAHVDLLPTLVATLGADVRGRAGLYEGRSLWPLLEGPGASWPPRPLFAQRRPAEEGEVGAPAELYALQDERLKYILHEPGDDELFDLAVDPHELTDIGAARAGEAARLRAALEERLRVYRAFAPAAGADHVPEEWTQELRDLGYVR